jgi:type I restriction enzyme S subunit
VAIALEAAPTPDTSPPPLPAGWRWARLGDVCELNPRRPPLVRSDDALTTFIPMPAVAEEGKGIIAPLLRPYAEIRTGFTYFAEGDVLFAKITPCMQNGKHAIARDLADGIGFGSTEFHVVRPGARVLAEWVHAYLIQPDVLAKAAQQFTGTVGQQRVPQTFLAELLLPLPPLPEQRRIAAILAEQMAAVERARVAAVAQLDAARELPAAHLRAVFEGDEAQGWPMRRLGEVLNLRKEVIHPRDMPVGIATFVGLEHIESLTGQRIGSVEIEKAALTGRKPQFCAGDIVYGYLRPYLNKVWIAEFDGLCSVDQYVYSVSPEADTEYIAWFMRSSAYLDRAPIDTMPGQLPRIRTEEVASVALNFPPIHEQRRIAQSISATQTTANAARQTLQTQVDAINQLPAALLRQAFSGEL